MRTQLDESRIVVQQGSGVYMSSLLSPTEDIFIRHLPFMAHPDMSYLHFVIDSGPVSVTRIVSSD